MRRATVLVQTAALTIAVVVVSVSICFWLVLGVPLPAPSDTSVGEMATALSHPVAAKHNGYDVRSSKLEPVGISSQLLQNTLADLLAVDQTRVRAHWQRNIPTSLGQSDAGQVLVVIAGQDVVIDSNPDGFNLSGGLAARLDADTRIPAFRASLQQDDGRWLAVTPPDAGRAAWRLRLLWTFIAIGLGVSPIAWWVAGRITQPMRRLAQAASSATLDPAGPPLPIEGPQEVREVSMAMNALRERLAFQLAERGRMLVAVAHDLRNPLTGLRLRAESAAPEVRSKMVDDIERMTEMITQVVDYTRDNAHSTTREAVDLSSLIADAVEAAISRGLTVRFSPPDGNVVVTIGRGDMRRAIDNLIDNAARYGGSANVSMEVTPDRIRITIRDKGPGIPEAEIPRILRPFERMEPSRNRDTGGMGLGLAIARDIVAQHGGELHLRNRSQGGLQVSIDIPRPAS